MLDFKSKHKCTLQRSLRHFKRGICGIYGMDLQNVFILNFSIGWVSQGDGFRENMRVKYQIIVLRKNYQYSTLIYNESLKISENTLNYPQFS